MRKWVRRAAVGMLLCGLGLIGLSEGWYHYELHHIEGRPFAPAEPPSEAFLTAARFTLGPQSLAPCHALALGGVFVVVELFFDASASSPSLRHSCGYFEYGISGDYLARTGQHRARWHSRRIAMGIWVARHLSREQALAAWVRYGQFGHGNLHDSAEWFFGRPPSELTLGERVTLLLFHRFGGRKVSRERRDGVLDRMHAEGLIGDAIWREERARPLPEKAP